MPPPLHRIADGNDSHPYTVHYFRDTMLFHDADMGVRFRDCIQENPRRQLFLGFIHYVHEKSIAESQGDVKGIFSISEMPPAPQNKSSAFMFRPYFSFLFHCIVQYPGRRSRFRHTQTPHTPSAASHKLNIDCQPKTGRDSEETIPCRHRTRHPVLCKAWHISGVSALE
jgi:hypothetical protein